MPLDALICIAILSLYGLLPGALEWVDGAHNSELSGPRPLAAEGSRSNDVLERTGDEQCE